MHPLISADQWLLSEHYSVKKQKIKRGDIVVFISPEDPTQYFCKRIISLEGDQVEKITVPKGHVWVEGDNKDHSNDSRTFGPVPYGLITNKVLFTVWPIYSIKSLRNKTI